MKEDEEKLNQDINDLTMKGSDIDKIIKAKEIKMDIKASQFFDSSIQPHLKTTLNFGQLTVGPLAVTTSLFR